MTDTELLDFMDEHTQYVVGHAPSGDWCAFSLESNHTCYGQNIRECLQMLTVMHKDIT